MSLSYILSVRRLQRTFGALHAKDPGLACPIMMHHHMIHIFIESVRWSRTNVPESITQLNKRQYILTLVYTKVLVVSVLDIPFHFTFILGNFLILGHFRLISLSSPLIPRRSVYGLA